MITPPVVDTRIGQARSRYDLNTPALIIDLDIFEQNIARMAEFMRHSGRKLRPHAKSHKSVQIAKAQIAAGATGICCATLDEAEVMVAGGIAGILITSPLTTNIKIGRLVELVRKAPNTMIVVDNAKNVDVLADAAAANNITLNVLIDVELGFGRTGVTSVDASEALARRIAEKHALHYAGIQAYGGHLQHTTDHAERLHLTRLAHRFIEDIIARLTMIGMPPAIVTGGGTGTHAIDGREGPFSEVQAGSYIFMDAEYRDVCFEEGSDWPFEHSLFVQTAVTSENNANMVTTDAGTKSFALNGPKPRIATAEYAALSYEYAGDEHGRVRGDSSLKFPELGEVIECIVSHCDPTVALYDIYHCVRNDRLVDIWPIGARGRRS